MKDIMDRMGRRRWLEWVGAGVAASGAAQTALAQGGQGPTSAAAALFDIRQFGAVGDGATVNTLAIQKAIDACSAAGGTVLVAGGRYATGTLYLKDNVCLRVEAGAVLLGSTRIADYATNTDRTMYPEPWMNRCLIFARDARNISIEGHGTIDGQGKSFPEQGDPGRNRPKMIRLLNCSRIRMRDISLQAPASWTTEWRYCSDIVVDGITIFSRANGNGDGLDFDGCSNVRVSNSTFDTSDDSICLQTSLSDKPCRDIAVTNCQFTSRWAGLRIGLLSRGDFENVAVTNCTFRNHEDTGLKIQMCEGAEMKNMVFSNLVMRNVPVPVLLTFSQKRVWVDAPPEPAPMKNVSNIEFSHIIVDTDTHGRDTAFIIVGMPGHPVRDIRFSDIRAIFPGGGTAEDTQRVLAELTPDNLKTLWPEYSTLRGPAPACGLYARHVQAIRLRNVEFSTKSPDARPPVVFVDVSDATFTDAPEPVYKNA